MMSMLSTWLNAVVKANLWRTMVSSMSVSTNFRTLTPGPEAVLALTLATTLHVMCAEGLGYADDGEEHESGEDDFAEEEDDAAGEGEGGASGGAGAGATHKAAARRSGPLVQSASKVEKSNVFKVATEVDDLASSAASAGYKKSSGGMCSCRPTALRSRCVEHSLVAPSIAAPSPKLPP